MPAIDKLPNFWSFWPHFIEFLMIVIASLNQVPLSLIDFSMYIWFQYRHTHFIYFETFKTRSGFCLLLCICTYLAYFPSSFFTIQLCVDMLRSCSKWMNEWMLMNGNSWWLNHYAIIHNFLRPPKIEQKSGKFHRC